MFLRILGSQNRILGSQNRILGMHSNNHLLIKTFIKDLQAGKVHGGTDGSVKHMAASHSWVLQSSRTRDFMAAHARTHPVRQKTSTKRPEAAGHAAALIVTRELLRGQTHSSCTMRFYVDNEAVVKGAAPSYKHGARHTLVPEWDVIHKIATLKKDIPIKTTTVWVKGPKIIQLATDEFQLRNYRLRRN
jgi:hypothetical protein